jgi:hypothetical protein
LERKKEKKREGYKNNTYLGKRFIAQEKQIKRHHALVDYDFRVRVVEACVVQGCEERASQKGGWEGIGLRHCILFLFKQKLNLCMILYLIYYIKHLYT